MFNNGDLIKEVKKISGIETQLESIETKSNVINVADLTDITYADNYTDVLSLQTINGVLWGLQDNNKIVKSDDEGVTWTFVTNAPFGSVRYIQMCSDGEMLVANNGQVVKTIGWSNNPSTCRWSSNKITLSSTNMPVGILPWGIDGDGKKFIVTEYSSAEDRSQSRYVWISTDGGNTFTIGFDKTTIDPNNLSHQHGVCYSPWDDLFVMIQGHDVVRGIYISKNGQTWTKIDDGLYLESYPTTITATSTGYVLGSDGQTNGTFGMISCENPLNMKLFPTCRWVTDRAGLAGFATVSVRDEVGRVYVSFKSNYDTVASVIICATPTSGKVVWTNREKKTNAFPWLSVTKNKVIGIIESASADKTRTKIVGLKSCNYNNNFDSGNIDTGYANNGTSIAIGRSVNVTTPLEIVIGDEACITGSTGNTVLGHKAKSKARGIAIGNECESNGDDSVLIGYQTKNDITCFKNVIIGNTATSVANNTGGVGIGYGSTSSTNGVAIGSGAKSGNVGNQGGVAIGQGSSSGNMSVSIGQNSSAGTYQVAIGNGAKATHLNSVALGKDVSTTKEQQVAIGDRHIEMKATTEPVSVPDGSLRLFARLNANNKLEFCVRIGGTTFVLATQP